MMIILIYLYPKNTIIEYFIFLILIIILLIIVKIGDLLEYFI